MANVTNTIGEAIARTMDQAKGPSEAMSDEQITARILQLKVSAGNAILEIGHWLVVMKSRLEHGAWGAWLAEQVDFSERIAQQYMRLSQEYGSNPNALSDLGKTKALKLLSIPADERSDFVQTHDVPNMSTRELEDAIRERDAARAAQAEAERQLAAERKDAEAREGMMRRASERIRELEERPVDVAVETDYAAIAAAEESARAEAKKEYAAKLAEMQNRAEQAEAKAESAKKKLKAAEATASNKSAAEISAARKAEAEAKAEAERLRRELDEAKRAQAAASVSGDADLAAFQILFDAVQMDVNRMHGILLKVRSREDGSVGQKLTAAILALADSVRRCAE